MRKSGRIIKVLGMAVLVLWGGHLGAMTQRVREEFITIVHTNDVHGRIKEESKGGVGFARIATQIAALRKENPHILLLDAGDALHGTSLANLSQGEGVVKAYDLLGYDAMVAGNHDFNYGWERLKELAKKSHFAILSANVVNKRGKLLLTPYLLKKVGDLKVAIVGFSTPETAYKSHPNKLRGVRFLDPIDEAKKLIPRLREKAHVVIALVHLGIDQESVDTSKRLAQEVKGIDLIVDGHSHTTLSSGLKVGSSLIVQAGDHAKNLGVVSLTYKSGKIEMSAHILSKEMMKGVPEDKRVLDLVTRIDEKNRPIVEEIVGTLDHLLDGERAHVRTGKTGLGDLIVGALLDATKADVALFNGGGIRASLKKGPVTRGDILDVLPFGNTVVVKKVTGAQILSAIENGVQSYPDPSGGFPHLGGLIYTFNPSKKAGERVVPANVMIQGSPLKKDAMYTLATNDFLSEGGDNYTMFKDATTVAELGTVDDVLIDYIRKKGFSP